MSDDSDLERLLRRALHERAAQITPAGDGLQRIQERVSRRRYLHWLRPAMATLAAAVAAVAIIAVPSMFNGSSNDSSDHHGGAAAQQQLRVKSVPATPTPSATQAPKLTPDRPAVWPYGSVRAADTQSTRDTRPEALATDLVESFTGTGETAQLKLATQLIHKGPQTEIAVRRADSGQAVCTMTLARASGQGRSYVITDAVSANVQIGSVPDLRRVRGPVNVSGIVSPAKGSTGLLRAEVRDAGQHSPGSLGTSHFNDVGVPDQAWSTIMNPTTNTELWPRHPIIAAWIVDGAGLPVGFAAQPAQGPEPLSTN
ncbi:MAG TPA: hypothetical protein VHC49_07110 [Mycobacteriales bacterium]|nr:hypothetical protein [Mycobacteriales bacterium]